MKTRSLSNLAALFLTANFLLPVVASAQLELTWDADGTDGTSPSDGGGAWLNTSRWWDGTDHTTWNNTTHADTIAIFGNGGTSGTVTLGTGVSAGGLRFGAVDTSKGYLIGAGTLTLATGSIIDIRNGASNAGAGDRVRFSSTSVLAGSNITISNAVQGTNFASYATFSGNNTWSGTLTLTGNATGLFVDTTTPAALNTLTAVDIGSTATLALNQSSTAYTVPTIRIAGTGLGNRGSLRFDNGTVTLNSNIVLTADGRMSTNASGIGIINGVISGGFNLSVNSSTDNINRIVLKNTNTFGQLTVSRGNVQIGEGGTGTSGLGVVNLAGDVSSANPAILSGTGTARSGVYVTGGSIRPGDNGGADIGTFNVTANLNYTGVSELGAPTTVSEFTLTGGGVSDKINVGGNLRLHGNGNIVLAFDSSYTTPILGDSWTIYSVVGTITQEDGFTFENNIIAPDLTPWGYDWEFSAPSSAGDVTATIVLIPEASAALLSLTGFLALATRRRR